MIRIRHQMPADERVTGVAFAPRIGLTLVFVVATALLGWLGWLGTETREQARLATRKAVRIAELRVTIVDLNEWLVMSAEMAAATGDHRWADRYEDIAPKLDAAIGEASEIATPDVRQTLAETAGEAHRDLVAMERRSLALAAVGDLQAARALLSSPEVDYLKVVYAGGIEVFTQDLKVLAHSRAADLDRRLWTETGGLALMAILIVAMAGALRGDVRLRAAIAHTAMIARTDALTGLPNRRQFYEDVEVALSDTRRIGLDHALLLIDLDRFKAVNDAHGHPAGDELLRLVGKRLQDSLLDKKRIARLGGDEFAFLLRCDPADGDQPQTDPAAVAVRIVAVLTKPFHLPCGAVVQVGASVGIGLTRSGEDSAEDLMQRPRLGAA